MDDFLPVIDYTPSETRVSLDLVLDGPLAYITRQFDGHDSMVYVVRLRDIEAIYYTPSHESLVVYTRSQVFDFGTIKPTNIIDWLVDAWKEAQPAD